MCPEAIEPLSDANLLEPRCRQHRDELCLRQSAGDSTVQEQLRGVIGAAMEGNVPAGSVATRA